MLLRLCLLLSLFLSPMLHAGQGGFAVSGTYQQSRPGLDVLCCIGQTNTEVMFGGIPLTIGCTVLGSKSNDNGITDFDLGIGVIPTEKWGSGGSIGISVANRRTFGTGVGMKWRFLQALGSYFHLGFTAEANTLKGASNVGVFVGIHL